MAASARAMWSLSHGRDVLEERTRGKPTLILSRSHEMLS
jgi:hypothetical protein